MTAALIQLHCNQQGLASQRGEIPVFGSQLIHELLVVNKCSTKTKTDSESLPDRIVIRP